MKLAGKVFGEHEHNHWFGADGEDGYLDALHISPETPEDRSVEGLPAYRTFEELAQSGREVIVLDKKINHSTNLAMLREMRPDLIFSARFLHIFKEACIGIPKYGVWNMHPGALPGYRGLHVDMRAMMAREEYLTMTMHVVDTGIDTGRVIGEAAVKVDPTTSLFMHRIRLHVGGMNMFFTEVMGLIAEQEKTKEGKGGREDDKAATTLAADTAAVSSEPAHGEQGRYFTWPEQEEYDEFEALGLQQCRDEDMQFVRGLFDRRLAQGPTIRPLESGLLCITE